MPRTDREKLKCSCAPRATGFNPSVQAKMITNLEKVHAMHVRQRKIHVKKGERKRRKEQEWNERGACAKKK